MFWGISESYNKLKLTNVPKCIKSIPEIEQYLKVKDIIKSKRIINVKNSNTNSIILTTDNYTAKLHLLAKKPPNIINITNNYDDGEYEKLHTKFIKFALGINIFASNYAIREEVGRFPLDITLNIKMV